MKAIQLTAPKAWRFIEIDPPPSPGPDEAVARVHRVGVCGTDVACYLGKFPYFAFPRIPGHELGVEIVAVGREVTQLKPGDRCCVEPYLNCQTCYACQRGFTNCCEHNQTYGVMCDGGLTEQIRLPARKFHPVGELTYSQAALVETLAIGCHAVDRSAPRPGESLLILGAGPIGLSVLEFAKLSGANVIVADISENRLEFVRRSMGVSQTILIRGDSGDEKQLVDLNQGHMADIVIDATGNHLSMVRALEFAAFAGRVVYVGITQNKLELYHAPVLHRRELTIYASRNARSSDFSRIVSLIQNGQISTDPWITHTGRFSQIPELFPVWTDPASGTIKAVIEMTD